MLIGIVAADRVSKPSGRDASFCLSRVPITFSA